MLKSNQKFDIFYRRTRRNWTDGDVQWRRRPSYAEFPNKANRPPHWDQTCARGFRLPRSESRFVWQRHVASAGHLRLRLATPVAHIFRQRRLLLHGATGLRVLLLLWPQPPAVGAQTSQWRGSCVVTRAARGCYACWAVSRCESSTVAGLLIRLIETRTSTMALFTAMNRSSVSRHCSNLH